MTMKLIGSLASPYVRKVRIVMAEKKLDYQLVLEDVWGSDAILKMNPLGKVPCLVMERTWAHRTPEQRSQAWIDRHLTKVSAALAAMSQGLGDKAWCSGNHFSLADIAVGCTLGWLEFRFPEIAWRETHPNLARHMDKLSQRQSFIDTAPR